MKKLIITFLLFSFLSIQYTTACVCKDFVFMPNVTQEDLQDSTIKFVQVEVISVEKIFDKKATKKLPRWRRKRGAKIVYNLATVKILKDYNTTIKTETIQIKTGLNSFHDCGFPFKEKKKYLIAMSKSKNDVWYTSVCLPSKGLNNATKDIALLNEHFN